jgi:cyclophilin family peptidyl-prolyl cis-trans isomerase
LLILDVETSLPLPLRSYPVSKLKKYIFESNLKQILMKKTVLSLIILFCLTFTSKAQIIVTFYTTMGSFEVELYDTLKPITAGNFRTLVKDKFYDGVIFHRIISNFVIQGGDPTGTGSGGPGYSIADEFDSSLSNVVKTLSMANSGPNTGGSQFFINTKDNTFLDFDKSPFTSAHPLFGVVINGWDIVQMIEAVAVNGNDRPIVPVVMDSLRVTKYAVGVNNIKKGLDEVFIYPNPTSKDVNLSFNYDLNLNYSFEVLDITGKVILSENNFSESSYIVDRSKLMRGIYLVKVTGNNSYTTVSKLIVK